MLFSSIVVRTAQERSSRAKVWPDCFQGAFTDTMSRGLNRLICMESPSTCVVPGQRGRRGLFLCGDDTEGSESAFQVLKIKDKREEKGGDEQSSKVASQIETCGDAGTPSSLQRLTPACNNKAECVCDTRPRRNAISTYSNWVPVTAQRALAH